MTGDHASCGNYWFGSPFPPSIGAKSSGGYTCKSGGSNEPPNLNIYIYFVNLITLKNIFAQLGLNLAHPNHKSI